MDAAGAVESPVRNRINAHGIGDALMPGGDEILAGQQQGTSGPNG